MNSDHAVETSPQVYARTGGMLYLIIIIAGILGEIFIRGKLIVPGNAAATTSNIMAHQLLWRIGIAGDLIMHICDIPLMLVFYILLRPVNKNLALLALLFNLIQTAVLVANKLNLLSVLFVAGSSPTQANFYIRLHEYGFGIGLIFFGCACLVYGYLIIKSGYLPKILGILLQIAGLCYLTNSFALIIAPEFANLLFPIILIPSFIAELSLCLWLLIKGVNVKKWNELVS